MAQGRIWLIGGTQESAALAIALAEAQLPCTISVTTVAARALYPNAAHLQVVVGRFGPEEVRGFLNQHQIRGILDASHPFALEISRQAIAGAIQQQLPYLRYERPALPPEPNGTVIELDGLEALLAGNQIQGQRVLLTLGYQSLAQFRPWQERATLFARILPSNVALDAALKAGFTGDRLVALRPPIPFELEKALWQHWQISLVVTKASGTPGGEDIKRAVALALGIKLVAIARPRLSYPQQTSDLSVALRFCQDLLESNRF